jgi:hypothetical protein
MNVFATIAVAIVFGIIVACVLALPVMWLWNACLVGAVAGVSEIGFLQALGISILCSILFKSNVSVNKS